MNNYTIKYISWDSSFDTDGTSYCQKAEVGKPLKKVMRGDDGAPTVTEINNNGGNYTIYFSDKHILIIFNPIEVYCVPKK